ncbi:type I restriction-modification system subunit M [Priestia aryabhattai]|uniref:type I restriction-modification system subunit M n=1 Tax=Priestia aryabhattai TaxID=412384 RepID=UPI0023AEB222|nr:type I restriction-modification system subunit M [Priestia aryabhattai]MDE8674464.1 N-6 DNA methylase [Priestia aryabhattai]
MSELTISTINIDMSNIKELERDLWEAADQLRANSRLTAAEYSMPVLGLIFLRHAYNKFISVKEKIESSLPSRGGRKREVTKEDFIRVNALYLPKKAQFEYLINLPEGEDIGKAISEAMKLIEDEYPNLAGALPKEYQHFESALLSQILKIFNREVLRNAQGDIFGRIYEYFLNKFAMTGAQEGGEFFTPMSLVQLIVNIIEPDHGVILDPASGSGGMFVQTGHFAEKNNKNPKSLTFYGQEKADTNTRLARMNMAVHGLEANIIQGNSFYEDHHELLDSCDFVMSNPPFNVDGVDAKKIENDPRLTFGLPGVNKKTSAVSNANYLWIQYFYSYLNDNGRAGFVMASSASDAGGNEKEIRKELVKTGHVDIMISISSNFFYTLSLPCTLWFFDKGKVIKSQNEVLMIDARNIYRKVTRTINDFSIEQLLNISSIVWLYRGQKDRFLKLIEKYLLTAISFGGNFNKEADLFIETIKLVGNQIKSFSETLEGKSFSNEQITKIKNAVNDLKNTTQTLINEYDVVNIYKSIDKNELSDLVEQHKMLNTLKPANAKIDAMSKKVDKLVKISEMLIDFSTRELEAKSNKFWNNREMNRLYKNLCDQRDHLQVALGKPTYYFQQAEWLLERFPEAKLEDILGLCKLVNEQEIEKHNWSLTPGRYVGTEPTVDEEELDFEELMKKIQSELIELDDEAEDLALIIQQNLKELINE